ncbi:universal stress protein [Streptomyces sp. NPDC090303]|uniref:universal stress protein n=1 Tax=Streptomyces sp. NPDC090303 TaxID=3365960 RepID=UPI003805846F
MESPLVVGVDGSDASLTAVDWAADEAVRHERPLRIIHASEWERYEGVAPDSATDRPPAQMLAESVVATAVGRVRLRAPALPVTTDVLGEDASTALLREGEGSLAVVVGSRGRGGFTELLLGSVGLVVAARAPCPVVVVRGDGEALEARHDRVLLGLGEQDADAPAVWFAFREAAVRDAELDVVLAVRRPAHAPPSGDPGVRAGGGPSEPLDRALEAAATANPRVRLRRRTVEGTAAKVLTERSAGADLLVLGARRRDALAGRELGRVAHRVLHHAACPVAVVPHRHGEFPQVER